MKQQIGLPRCKRGYTLIGDTCFQSCQSGTLGHSLDVSLCVQDIACPPHTTLDTLNNTLCFKTAVSAPPCSSGFSEVNGSCLIDCPVSFSEQTTACAKRSYSKLTASPSCASPWETLDANGECQLGAVSWFLIVAGVVLIGFLIWHWTTTTTQKQPSVYFFGASTPSVY